MNEIDKNIIKVIDSNITINDTNIFSLDLGLSSFLTFTGENQNFSFGLIFSNIFVSKITQNIKSASPFINITCVQRIFLLDSFFLSNTVCNEKFINKIKKKLIY